MNVLTAAESLGETAVSTATKPMLPWILLGAMLAGCLCVGAGMYLGYELANGRNAKEWSDLKDAQAVALKAKTDAYVAANARGDEIAGKFETLLKNIKIENKTFNSTVRTEVEKAVYTTCILPDTGTDLLQKHATAANLRLMMQVPPPLDLKAPK